ncbi:T9SS C-terminal target domain-containing protein [Chryseobacterium indologenes]|uniref:T9SS type A sorting domain-containing protein n=1 Tax=Chryseobacterium indologenes TaxID=253 RepID=UPI000F4EC000|nr:T9SS type A sorting domain-containing protein [Chryseobacterium indologenes]AYZ36565.1 T9SS C-terminal target domain-containing protein [Chryseobacterium indologenes]MBF6645253.1 T9SS type A sorting domain-containing protein [Chryseobacterium indologenes]MBU3048689.1 T9SS type A sorting domain-containing protein [Chryseobacterium indologenes]MEB4762058.1 T9SS type A sorting domain-containing protein [Chryseobacterium indologenes]QQQ71076.1 T9SS type A sorting domain-containing protein [Chry
MKLKLLLGTLLLTAVTANAQLTSINENFDTFVAGPAGPAAAWPQKNWNRVQNATDGPWVYAAGGTNKTIQYYSFSSANTAGYLISPQIVAPDGTKTVSFTAALTSGSASGATGTLEVGLVNSTSDMSSFTPIGSVINLNPANTQYSLQVPASANQYIAFKMIGSAMHTAIQMDDVVYDSATLAVIEKTKSENEIRFAVNPSNTILEFITRKDPKKILVYSASGQKVSEGKLNGKQFDISHLQTGVYYLNIETADGKTVQSKFIKK